MAVFMNLYTLSCLFSKDLQYSEKKKWSRVLSNFLSQGKSFFNTASLHMMFDLGFLNIYYLSNSESSFLFCQEFLSEVILDIQKMLFLHLLIM